MRNLSLLTVAYDKLGLTQSPKCMVVDALSDTIFFATSNEVFAYSLTQKKIYASVTIDCNGGILAMECLVDSELLSIATADGDLYEWSYASQSLECVGTMDSGIDCMSWSPDQEIMLLVTGNERLVLMTRDLDPIFETELNPSEFGEAQPVTVGWGKKETQFHGSEGKPKVKDVENEEVQTVLPWDDRRVRVSWCEDGQSFAVSSVDRRTGCRKIRVRLHDGSLFSTSEAVDGLEQSLHFKPNGSLIASSQRKPNKHDIIFFEKNGLRHGEFSLPFSVKEVKVIELCWNKASEVLAVWLEHLETETNSCRQNHLSYIQLWTRSNYHWYLKQEIRFSAMGLQVSCLVWDAQISMKLHVLCSGGEYYQFTWRWKISESEDSWVAVIDGANLLLTPFAKAVIPPPMSLKKIKLPSPVNQICFGKCSSSITVALSDGTLHQLEFTEDKIVTGAAEIIYEKGIEPGGLQNTFGFFHLTHWKDNSYITVSLYPEYMDSICYLESSKDNSSKILVRNCLTQSEKVNLVVVSADSLSVAIQMENGEIYTCHKGEDGFSVQPWITPSGYRLRLPHLFETMSIGTFNHEDFLVGMTSRFLLFFNDRQIADNCTSFALHDEFLVYTSHNHRLHCVPLSTLLNFLHSGLKSDFSSTEHKRQIERGSKIISVIKKDTKVILQMPRGNLETIHPRPLVISLLKRFLDRTAYKEAFSVMKKNRINLNLIYDHRPKLFLENVGTFISQLNSETDINLFLADLIEDDVTHSLYASCYSEMDRQTNQPEPSASKIDTICLAIRNSIRKVGVERYFLSFLTSYAKQTTPDLETVLLEIKKVKDKILRAEVTFEHALKHILYLTDVNDLYDVALGLYDFDIILMIAEKSNKDPKEYLPFLNELRSYDENYRKFKIDSHLKRHTKALTHIYHCGNRVTEFLEFVTCHELYKETLGLCGNDDENSKRVNVLYGTYLMKKAKHNEAGLVFSRAGQHQKALDAFILCLNWRLALCAAAKLEYSKEKRSTLARNLADQLKEKHKYSEATSLLEVYVGDYESAITTAIDGYLWEDALRLIYHCGRLDLIETNFITAMLDAFRHYIEMIDDMKKRYLQYKGRLAVVRDLKQKQLEIPDDERDETNNDLFSDTSSITGQSCSSRSSKMSRTSGHSSKSRRKLQRKKYSLKEGSKFEDFALMEALADIVTAADSLQDKIASVLHMLVMFSYNCEAKQLQKGFADCLNMIETTTSDIWDPKADTVNQNNVIGPNSTVNSILAGFDQSKQANLVSNNDDFPPLTKPVLRKGGQWMMSQFT